MENKKDYIVRGTAANGQIRCFAITSRNLVEEARSRHQTSPVITAALGRLLSGGAMMGAMMKGEKDLLTLQIQCSGPVQGLSNSRCFWACKRLCSKSGGISSCQKRWQAGCWRCT